MTVSLYFPRKASHNPIHPYIPFLNRLFLKGLRGVWCLAPAVNGREAEYTLDRSSVHHRGFNRVSIIYTALITFRKRVVKPVLFFLSPRSKKTDIDWKCGLYCTYCLMPMSYSMRATNPYLAC